MKILIGAPVYAREWILPFWFSAIEKQTVPLSDIGFIFEAAPNDEKTIDSLFSWYHNHPQVWCFDVQVNEHETHQSHLNGARKWNHDRYHTMVAFRNNLLDRAICHDPDRYFSLDTDILLEDHITLERLVEFTENPVAVAPLMFMTPNDQRAPSVMSWVDKPGGVARRTNYPLGTTFQADVIMAAKMMSKPIYQNVRYRWHRQGEDLGWSAACAEQNYKLYSMSEIYAPHIMSETMLETYLIEGDHRSMTNINS